MSDVLQISQEFLKIGGNRTLGPQLLAKVEHLLEKYSTSKFLTPPEFHDLQDLIQKETGLNIKLEYFVCPDMMLGIFCPVFSGHNGISGRSEFGSMSMRDKDLTDNILKSTVDLEKGRVMGEFTKVPFQMLIPSMLFEGKFSAEELTAGILHEIGHAFFAVATLGEYTWLNYYLTDGMDVLLGKKPNRYKVELLNYDYLAQNVDDQKQREQLLSDPSEKNLRRAVLEACYKQPRNHLTTNVVRGSIKRDEQLADVFAMRMGFTRPLATFMDKVQRSSGAPGKRYLRSRTGFLAMEMVKALSVFTSSLVGVGLAYPTLGLSLFLPLAVHGWVKTDGSGSRVYDNPTERLVKMRRELVTQIKDLAVTPTAKLALDEDLKVLDNLLDKRNQYMSLWEAIGYTLAPGARREHYRLKHEELLEGLLANDLFVQANRFNQHT